MSGEERNDTEEEEMDHESQRSEVSDIEDSDRASSSETEESSDVEDEEVVVKSVSGKIDEETAENRKCEYTADLQELDQAFHIIKKLLYEERMRKINEELFELREGRASAFLKPLTQLKERMHRRSEVAKVKRKLQLELVKVQYESEQLAAHQNLENEKLQLFDTVRGELEEKIRRLEEDRNSIDIHSDLWETQLLNKKPKRKIKGSAPAKERKKKPTLVTGPYIIYMLPDMDILEDWTLIKKAVKQRHLQRRKGEGGHRLNKPVQPYLAKYEDGRLNYQGETYSKGHHIIIDNKEDSPVHATVTAINTGEIWVKKADGNKSKLYIAQLQKGKYTIRHLPY